MTTPTALIVILCSPILLLIVGTLSSAYSQSRTRVTQRITARLANVTSLTIKGGKEVYLRRGNLVDEAILEIQGCQVLGDVLNVNESSENVSGVEFNLSKIKWTTNSWSKKNACRLILELPYDISNINLMSESGLILEDSLDIQPYTFNSLFVRTEGDVNLNSIQTRIGDVIIQARTIDLGSVISNSGQVILEAKSVVFDRIYARSTVNILATSTSGTIEHSGNNVQIQSDGPTKVQIEKLTSGMFDIRSTEKATVEYRTNYKRSMKRYEPKCIVGSIGETDTQLTLALHVRCGQDCTIVFT